MKMTFHNLIENVRYNYRSFEMHAYGKSSVGQYWSHQSHWIYGKCVRPFRNNLYKQKTYKIRRREKSSKKKRESEILFYIHAPINNRYSKKKLSNSSLKCISFLLLLLRQYMFDINNTLNAYFIASVIHIYKPISLAIWTYIQRIFDYIFDITYKYI